MAAPSVPAAMDLRRAGLGDLRAVDFRAPERDPWMDEAALWDRLVASWAGLDEAAWHLPGAAPSDAGGPDWSLAEHVGHVADWQELAIVYVATARATGRWPSDNDFDGGDFDRIQRGPSRAVDGHAVCRDPRAPGARSPAPARRRPTVLGRRDPRGRSVGLGLPDPARTLPRSPRRHRAMGRCAAGPAGGRRSVPRRPAGDRPCGLPRAGRRCHRSIR